MTLEKQIQLAQRDCIYFIETFGKTFDPRTEEKDLPFILYDFQKVYVLDLINAIQNKEDLFTEKSRDMGVSWLTLYVIVWFWLFVPGFQALLGSRKEDEVDNGTIKSLFGRVDYILRFIPFKPEGFDPGKHRTFMKLISPVTGSTIIGESANQNYSRGARFNVDLFDEFAFWPFQQSSWESAGDSTPCRIAVTTPSEVPGFAKQLRNSGKVKLKTLHWTQHPLKTQHWYEEQKKRRTEDEVARELDINWEGSTKGIVYGEISNAQVGKFPYIPNNPIYVSWDFGRDGTAIQWWQLNRENSKWRLIDSFFFQDQTLDYVFPAFGAQIDNRFNYSLNDIEFFERMAQLPSAVHFGDPDVEKRNLQTTQTNRQFLFNKAGIYVKTNTKAIDFLTRRTFAKRLLQKGVEINETVRNTFWLESLRNYAYPQRREDSQNTRPAYLPVHNIFSHHSTSFEYLAANVDQDLNYPDPVAPTMSGNINLMNRGRVIFRNERT